MQEFHAHVSKQARAATSGHFGGSSERRNAIYGFCIATNIISYQYVASREINAELIVKMEKNIYIHILAREHT